MQSIVGQQWTAVRSEGLTEKPALRDSRRHFSLSRQQALTAFAMPRTEFAHAAISAGQVSQCKPGGYGAGKKIKGRKRHILTAPPLAHAASRLGMNPMNRLLESDSQ
jgi:hypothetical protein